MQVSRLASHRHLSASRPLDTLRSGTDGRPELHALQGHAGLLPAGGCARGLAGLVQGLWHEPRQDHARRRHLLVYFRGEQGAAALLVGRMGRAAAVTTA